VCSQARRLYQAAAVWTGPAPHARRGGARRATRARAGPVGRRAVGRAWLSAAEEDCRPRTTAPMTCTSHVSCPSSTARSASLEPPRAPTSCAPGCRIGLHQGRLGSRARLPAGHGQAVRRRAAITPSATRPPQLCDTVAAAGRRTTRADRTRPALLARKPQRTAPPAARAAHACRHTRARAAVRVRSQHEVATLTLP